MSYFSALCFTIAPLLLALSLADRAIAAGVGSVINLSTTPSIDFILSSSAGESTHCTAASGYAGKCILDTIPRPLHQLLATLRSADGTELQQIRLSTLKSATKVTFIIADSNSQDGERYVLRVEEEGAVRIPNDATSTTHEPEITNTPSASETPPPDAGDLLRHRRHRHHHLWLPLVVVSGCVAPVLLACALATCFCDRQYVVSHGDSV